MASSSSSSCNRSCIDEGDDYKLYNVKFYEDCIETTVTSTARIVDHWIHETYCFHGGQGNKFFAGLDTEWCLPHVRVHQGHHVAILQLCVGRRCLIFQLLFSNGHGADKIMNNNKAMIPRSLVEFLSDKNITFVGKEVEQDAKLLLGDWGLRVACVKDVSHMAAAKYRDSSHRRMGLNRLAMEFLEKPMDKSKKITLSRWDAQQLTRAQVQYASIDAFVSLLLGMLFDFTTTTA